MKTYIIIRNSESEGMDAPEIFANYRNASARFVEIVDEEKEYINFDSEYCDAVITEDTVCYGTSEEHAFKKQAFVYIDDDGMHETRLFICETKED